MWLAAVKACGTSAVLSHYSAAALWGFVEWDDRKPEVTVTKQGIPRHQAIRVHRSSCLERRDWMLRDGIPVTAAARTLLDLAALVPPKQLRRAVRQAMSLQRVGIRQLAEVIARTGPRRGSRKLARIIADGYTPTASPLEDIVLDLVLAGGFERPDINEAMILEGRRIVPDLRWAAQRIVVEADSRTWHDNKIAREDDAERQAILEAHGEHVIRITSDQALTKQRQTLERIRTAGAPQAYGMGPAGTR